MLDPWVDWACFKSVDSASSQADPSSQNTRPSSLPRSNNPHMVPASLASFSSPGSRKDIDAKALEDAINASLQNSPPVNEEVGKAHRREQEELELAIALSKSQSSSS
jgi:hypothetical protein